MQESLSRIQQNPVGKTGFAIGLKLLITWVATVALQTANDIRKSLLSENKEVNKENVEQKLKELDDTWTNSERAMFTASDTTFILYPVSMLAEKLIRMGFPAFAAKKIAGQMLHSFIVSQVFSGLDTFNDQLIVMACEALFKEGTLTQDEIKELYLLEKRAGASYFIYGRLVGNPAQKSAYKKVSDKVLEAVFANEEARSIVLGGATRNYVLNGNTIVSFATVLATLIIKDKLLPTPKRFPVLQNTVYSVAMAALASALVPQTFNDKITFFLNTNWAKVYSVNTKNLQSAQSSKQILDLLSKARVNREKIANSALYIIKVSSDRIEEERRGNKSATVMEEYQNNMRLAFENLRAAYLTDEKTYTDFILAHPNYFNEVYPEVKNLQALSEWSTSLRDSILNQYQARNFDYVRDTQKYSINRQKLDRWVLSHFSEKDILLPLQGQ